MDTVLDMVGCLTEAWSDNMKLLAVLSLALFGVVMAEPGYGHGYYGGYGHGYGLGYGDMVMATTDTVRGLLTLRLNLPLLPSPDTDMEDTVDMVDMDMDTVILDMVMVIDMAGGLLMLRPAMDMVMDTDMEVMAMDMAMEDMAM